MKTPQEIAEAIHEKFLSDMRTMNGDCLLEDDIAAALTEYGRLCANAARAAAWTQGIEDGAEVVEDIAAIHPHRDSQIELLNVADSIRGLAGRSPKHG